MPPRNGLRENGRGRSTTGRRNRANQAVDCPVVCATPKVVSFEPFKVSIPGL